MNRWIARGLGLALVTLVPASALADEPAAAPPPREPTAVDAALKRAMSQVNLTAGTSTATPEVRLNTSGAPIDGKSKSLGGTGGATNARATAAAGKPPELGAPKVAEFTRTSAHPSRSRRAHAQVQDPQRDAIEALNPKFATCLTAADTAVDGTAVLNASITTAGDVTSAAMVTPGGVSPKAAACFKQVVATAKFAPVAEASVVQVRVVPRDLRPLVETK